MPQNDTQSDQPADIEIDLDSVSIDKEELKLIKALREASVVGMTMFNNMDDVEPYGVSGITELDGRKRLVRRFKRVADEIGYRKYEYVDREHEFDEKFRALEEEQGKPEGSLFPKPSDECRFVLKYDSHQRSYSLQHRTVDSTQSMPRKAASYQQIQEKLDKRGFTSEGRVYSRVD